MSVTDETRDALRSLVAEALRSPEFRRATFAGKARSRPSPWLRVVVRPVSLHDERCLQFGYFDGRKTITKNFSLADCTGPIDDLLAVGFAGIHLSTAQEEIDLRLTKKGKLRIGRRAAAVTTTAPTLAHNRVKDHPIPEGIANPLLQAMGILTAAGRVRPTMRAKFTQINEFLKHLRHALDDTDLLSVGREVTILDCGCGASYLTLAVHFYLNETLGVPARILGVDVNEEVIRKSVQRVEHLGTRGIDLQCATIESVDTKADIVLALHACDTATDDAIARAVRSEARLALIVPCCHHDLNREMRAQGPIEVLRPLLMHGILRERLADLLTDAFRARALRILGYKTEVVEFVSPEHTARNLMIRAVRGPTIGDETCVREYLAMRAFCGVVPCIEGKLGAEFQQLLHRK